MTQSDQDNIFLQDLDNKPRGPWRAIVLVALITLVAIWLVPGEKSPEEQMPRPAADKAPGPASIPAGADKTASTATDQTANQNASATKDSQSEPQKQATLADSGPEPNPVAGQAEQQKADQSALATRDAASIMPGTRARQLIRQLDAAKEVDMARAVAQAKRHLVQGDDEDAYLLYFYAARHGDGEAAFTLAQHADPAHHQATGLFPRADVRQALKWYQRAQQAGHPAAQAAFAQLRESLKRAADQGDGRARRLLLQWD